MIEPLGYTVLIKPEEIETKSKGGIITVLDNKVDQLERASICGTIMAVGELAWMRSEWNYTHWANVGDGILFAKYAGATVIDPESGEKYILIADEDIKCRYKKGELTQSLLATNQADEGVK